jgi:tetratricopeptide (TPR) repeat protein
VERHGRGVLDLDYHSYQWLSYAYLQLGRRQEAKAIVDSVTVLLEHQDARGRHWNVANGVHIQNVQWGFETGDWSFYEDRRLPEPDPSAGFLGYTLPLYGHGMAAANRGDVEMVERVTRALRVEGPPNPPARAIMALQIEAVHALEAGDPDRAASLSEEAMVSVEAFPTASPPLFQPPYELHGEIMLRAGRVEEAAKAFDRALERFPARTRSQLARARAAAEAGDVEAARRFYRLLLDNWQRADRDLPELAEASGFAGGND